LNEFHFSLLQLAHCGSFICGVSHIFPVSSVNSFIISCRLVVDCVSDIVDYWVTFNEPHVFCLLTYCAGAWPGGHPDMLEAATSALPTGVFPTGHALDGHCTLKSL
jgi:hypothetical protein